MNKTAAFVLAACISALSVAQTKDSDDESSFITYKIKAGDTFNQFAQKYLQQPVDLNEIYKVNPIKSVDLLPIGAELNIPRHMLKHRPSKAAVMRLSAPLLPRVQPSKCPQSAMCHCY
jgi:nucleoid-associated protein YgaU